MPTLLEICCGSIDDAVQAESGCADRVELCSALFLGGLTPSIGTMRETRERLKIPIIAMVRSRAGGFAYTEAEFAAMERDAAALLEAGADGLVFGVLTNGGTIDVPRTKRLREIAGAKEAVFHRAFDVTPDPFRALDELVELGIKRVLTSGQQASVPDGLDLIRRLVEYAGDRIEILPGGGIRPHNVLEVIARTGCRQVHLTAFRKATDSSTQHGVHVTFAGGSMPKEGTYDVTDAELVRQIAEKLS